MSEITHETNVFAALDRQRAYDAIDAATNPADAAIQQKRAITREVYESDALSTAVLREFPSVYAGSLTDVAYPLALGCRHIVLVDPTLASTEAKRELGQRIKAITGEEAYQDNDTFSFLFDFGDGDETVTVKPVAKYYNPEPPKHLPFMDRPEEPIPDSERYVLPEQTGMVLGFASHFESVQPSDVDKLVPGGVILDASPHSVAVHISEQEWNDILREDTDALAALETQKFKDMGLERITLAGQVGDITFARKNEQ